MLRIRSRQPLNLVLSMKRASGKAVKSDCDLHRAFSRKTSFSQKLLKANPNFKIQIIFCAFSVIGKDMRFAKFVGIFVVTVGRQRNPLFYVSKGLKVYAKLQVSSKGS